MAGSDRIIAYLRACEASEKATRARAALSPGSSRAAITSANARWSRQAEERNRIEQELLPETVLALQREMGRTVENGDPENLDQLKLFEGVK
jgi:hypothetical protein